MGRVRNPDVANVANVSHQSPRLSSVAELLHRPDHHPSVLFVVIVLWHLRGRIVHVNVNDHPTAWTAQQVVDAFPNDTAPKRLHRDRDSAYRETFRRRAASFRIVVVVAVISVTPSATAPATMNGHPVSMTVSTCPSSSRALRWRMRHAATDAGCELRLGDRGDRG